MTARGLRRRQLLAWLGLLALPVGISRAGARARVVVVGGGFAGATAARLLREAEPALDITLVEPRTRVHTCPGSNAVIAGLRAPESIVWSFRALEAQGIRHLHQSVWDIDPVTQRVQLDDRRWLVYDWLLLAPGIEFRYDTIEGYDAAAVARMPHAWRAGPQTLLLRRQLQAMADNGLVVIGVPDNPYRCPPGPYERASLIAHYLRLHKPRAKVLILDAKDSFSKQALFRQGWAQRYPDLIEWRGKADDGRVVRVDGERLEVECEFGTRQRASVVNLIPPQRAGAIAARAGLTDASGWVPVDPRTFGAQRAARIQVIGDACIAAPMPKSAWSAHAQARQAVAALLAELHGAPLPAPQLDNTCYSLLAPGEAVSITARYQVAGSQLGEVPGSLRLSPLEGGPALRAQEATEAEAWYNALGQAIWGARA